MGEEVKLALIPPVELLEYTDETFCQLALPHMIASSETYRYVYQTHCDDPNQFVILDNGAAEGLPIVPQYLARMGIEMGVDELVIPDVLHELDANLDRAKRFHELHLNDFVQAGIKLMFVVQGRNYKEFLLSALWATSQSWIDTIGIPRHAIQTTGQAEVRWDLAGLLRDESPKPVHLLGASPNFLNEIEALTPWPDNVRSTDTSSPFNASYYGLSLHGGSTNIARPDRYFERSADAFNPQLVEDNVKLLMEWTGNDV